MSKYPFPKVDLHLHLDGSNRISTIWELTQEQNIELPGKTIEEYEAYLIKAANCGSVNEYLKMFDAPILAMQKPEVLERLTFELIEDLANQGLRYAEIRFAPQLHTQQGMSQKEAVAAVLRGKEKACEMYPQIKIGIITCMMCIGTEDLNWKENDETVDVCAEFKDKGVVALDLAGVEGIVPLSNFAPLFKKGKELGLNLICHAGDSQGPETVWDAISFGVTRIGHGHNTYRDPELCKVVAEKEIALEHCPTSNVQCLTVPSYEGHPAKKLFDMGIRTTINTDNMTFAHTTLDDEYDHCMNEMGFSYDDVIVCVMNSVKSSFADEEYKKQLLEELESYR